MDKPEKKYIAISSQSSVQFSYRVNVRCSFNTNEGRVYQGEQTIIITWRQQNDNWKGRGLLIYSCLQFKKQWI